MQYTFVTKFLPVDFEGTLYNSADFVESITELHICLLLLQFFVYH